jgi:Na+/H+-dicarboxylate symporter
MPSSPPPVGGSLSRVTAPRLLPLFLGVGGGAFVSLSVALAGGRSAVAVRWLLRLPGGLLLHAFVGLSLPLVALHAALTGVQAARLKTQWMPIAAATLTASALATLLASGLGALLAVALQSIVPSSSTLSEAWLMPSGATVAFVCPGETANGSVALQSDGTLACSENATTFVIDDVARTFVVEAMPRAWTVAEQVVTVAESVCLQSLAGAFVGGDVLSLVVGGLALGAALVGLSSTEKELEGDEDSEEEVEVDKSFVLLQLVAQAEALGCRVLDWLLKYLPISVAFMISSVLLQSSSPSASDDSDVNAAVAAALALMAVLLLALVLDVVVMLILATAFTRSNPFAFLEHLLPAQLLALSSGSPLVALPVTVSSVVASQRVSAPLAFVVCAAGSVLAQAGTALYLSVSAVFVLTASGSGVDGDAVTAIVFANVLIASVVSPLPARVKTAALATLLGAVFGVPAGPRVVMLAFLSALEWATGPFVSCVNVTNTALIAMVVAHYYEAAEADGESSAPTPESPVQVPGLREQRVLGVVHSENWV